MKNKTMKWIDQLPEDHFETIVDLCCEEEKGSYEGILRRGCQKQAMKRANGAGKEEKHFNEELRRGTNCQLHLKS